MNDRELLAFAAMAYFDNAPTHIGDGVLDWVRDCKNANWKPLTDDGDALRLAVKLKLNVVLEYSPTYHYAENDEYEALEYENGCCTKASDCNGDPYAATRRAIVRAAAEIGKAMEGRKH